MAQTLTENWGMSPACGWGAACVATFLVEYNNRSFGRDTDNCERALISGRLENAVYGSNLGWASVPGNACHRSHLSSNADTTRENWSWCTDKGPKCKGNFDYRVVHSNAAGCFIDKDTTDIAIDYYWQFTPSSHGWQYMWTPRFNLSDNERIYPPEGLSVSWPNKLGNNFSCSISKWSKNVNIGGTPTTYPNAKYWNWAVDLLNTSGTMLAHYANNYYESKSVTLPTNGFYTASALPGSSAATGSAYPIPKNSAFKLRVVVNNSFNQQQSATSGVIYSLPPDPNVTINSMLYVPASKDCTLNFSWSKPTDGGAYTETIKYDVYNAKGTYYKNGVVLATVSGGGSRSGTVTVTGLPSGEQYFVRVYVTATSGIGSTTKSVYAPVANAAFLGFDWDDVRRTCTIRAEAPGAANCRIQAGYSSNVYDVGNKLTSGQIGTLVVKDLNHGSGQILYLQAVPEASDGHQYTNEIAKISIPIPNPILGVHTPSCEKIEAGAEREYIVDIIEKKKGSSACTQRWQNGDRVVKKDESPPFNDIRAIWDAKASLCIDSTTHRYKAGSYWEIKMGPYWMDRIRPHVEAKDSVSLFVVNYSSGGMGYSADSSNIGFEIVGQTIRATVLKNGVVHSGNTRTGSALFEIYVGSRPFFCYMVTKPNETATLSGSYSNVDLTKMSVGETVVAYATHDPPTSTRNLYYYQENGEWKKLAENPNAQILIGESTCP